MLKIRVTEKFYSVSGEGISQGNPFIFIRFWGCNLHCGYDEKTRERKEGTWQCDSTSSWLYGKEDAKLYEDPDELLTDIILSVPTPANKKAIDIIFTGGEPLLFINDDILDILDILHEQFNTIYFETNGTIPINRFKYTLEYVKFNCSPKTSNSGIPFDKRINIPVLKKINKISGSCFKFVVSSKKDIEEILFIIGQVGMDPLKIYLMPEGQTREEIEKNLLICAEYAIKYGFRVSNRMQVQIWNKTMGV